ncbi:chorismate synthase [Candidatus Peregrinibacteria bacterium]|nr:chorismate synthase [Candidatus Peregrinibacteria bacterium]
MNTLGHLFRVTTWGESHGKALGLVVDGCPPNLPLSEEYVQKELDKRKPSAKGSTARREPDQVEILSGVFEGKTLGTPICMLVRNIDQKPEDYAALKNTFRKGHADLTYQTKFGIRDHRGGGRASGRETVARVMAGAVARLILPKIKIESHFDQKIIKKAEKAAEENDSIGGIVEIIVKNSPAGLGSPVFGKLQAELAKALLSVGAVKGFEFGEGFAAAALKGSEHNEKPTGGMAGGISDGSDIILRVAIKPPSSVKIGGRHDACLIPRINIVLESMVAIVLADQFLMQKTNV